MNRDEKAVVIDEIAAQIEGSEAVLAVDYRGISVPQIADLRAKLGEADASFRIVKNRLTIRAADKAGVESLKELLQGPTAFTFVHGDAALAAKAIANFRKEHEVLEFKGGTMAGEVVTIEELQALARLPGRDALNAQLAGIVASPITGLVRGLGSLISGLAIALKQVEEQGLVSGEAPAAEEEAPAAEEEAPPAEEEAPGPEEEAPPAEETAPDEPAEADEPPADTSEDESEAPSEDEDADKENE